MWLVKAPLGRIDMQPRFRSVSEILRKPPPPPPHRPLVLVPSIWNFE